MNKMNKWGKDKDNPANEISPGSWKKHFENHLNGEGTKETTCGHVATLSTFDPSLDGRVTKNEIDEALRKMTPGKAPGPDGILTEYLKAFNTICVDILLKLMRTLFSNHTYPSTWRLNFLKPIHKKGDVKDPHN